MKQIISKNITRVPIAEIINHPSRTGTYDIWIDHWWIKTHNHELLFYKGHPQCNADRRITQMLQKRLYPDCLISKVPLVYRKARNV